MVNRQIRSKRIADAFKRRRFSISTLMSCAVALGVSVSTICISFLSADANAQSRFRVAVDTGNASVVYDSNPRPIVVNRPVVVRQTVVQPVVTTQTEVVGQDEFGNLVYQDVDYNQYGDVVSSSDYYVDAYNAPVRRRVIYSTMYTPNRVIFRNRCRQGRWGRRITRRRIRNRMRRRYRVAQRVQSRARRRYRRQANYMRPVSMQQNRRSMRYNRGQGRGPRNQFRQRNRNGRNKFRPNSFRGSRKRKCRGGRCTI